VTVTADRGAAPEARRALTVRSPKGKRIGLGRLAFTTPITAHRRSAATARVRRNNRYGNDTTEKQPPSTRSRVSSYRGWMVNVARSVSDPMVTWSRHVPGVVGFPRSAARVKVIVKVPGAIASQRICGLGGRPSTTRCPLCPTCFAGLPSTSSAEGGIAGGMDIVVGS